MTITQDKKDVDINGYVTYYDVPMTKVGVFPYLGRTISPELEPDKIYMVLRPEEELTNPDTLKSLEKIPFVNEHTMLGDGFTPAEDKGIEGTTLTNVKVKLPLITNDLVAYTDRVKEEIENGKRELSLGYRCIYDLTSGDYNGEHYDAVQRNIRFNHIALVPEGRMGSECRVMDNSIVYDRLDIKDVKNKEQKMAKITLDEDLKEELKEEIKKELLGDGEEVIEKKEKITDETPVVEEKPEEAPTVDGDEDKRKLIDEIGGILKDKVDEEVLRTVLKKAEELAYNPSETGANDECGKDEKVKTEEDEEENKPEGLSMDEAVKYFAKRDEIIERVSNHIGDNVNYKSMTLPEVVKYACDKLDIKPSLKGLEGYLTGAEKAKKLYVTVAKDNSYTVDEKSEFMKNYLK